MGKGVEGEGQTGGEREGEMGSWRGSRWRQVYVTSGSVISQTPVQLKLLSDLASKWRNGFTSNLSDSRLKIMTPFLVI